MTPSATHGAASNSPTGNLSISISSLEWRDTDKERPASLQDEFGAKLAGQPPFTSQLSTHTTQDMTQTDLVGHAKERGPS